MPAKHADQRPEGDENTDRFDEDREVRSTWAAIETDEHFSLAYFRKAFAEALRRK